MRSDGEGHYYYVDKTPPGWKNNRAKHTIRNTGY